MPTFFLSIFRFVRLLMGGYEAIATRMLPSDFNMRRSSENGNDRF